MRILCIVANIWDPDICFLLLFVVVVVVVVVFVGLVWVGLLFFFLTAIYTNAHQSSPVLEECIAVTPCLSTDA